MTIISTSATCCKPISPRLVNASMTNLVCEGIDMSFDTAWAPPKPVVAAASKAFPTLTFDHAYLEESLCFSGRTRYSDGNIASEQVYDDVPDTIKLAVWGYVPSPEAEDC
jgi:hypothetical protein